jgi:hypothetical protein
VGGHFPIVLTLLLSIVRMGHKLGVAEAFESGRGSTLSRRGAASIQFVAFCGQ